MGSLQDELLERTKIAPELERCLKQWLCHVRFQIPSPLKGWEYRHWLYNLLIEFVGQDERNKFCRPSLNEESCHEGGISNVYVNGYLVSYSKMFWYGCENPIRGIADTCWQGLMFRDHEDKSIYTTRDIYVLADGFEQFLRTKKIPFRRYGLRSGGDAKKPRRYVLQKYYRAPKNAGK